MRRVLLLVASLQTACGPAFVVGFVGPEGGEDSAPFEASTLIDKQEIKEAGVEVDVEIEATTDTSIDTTSDVAAPPIDAAPVCAFGATRCQGYVVMTCTAAGQWAASSSCLVECCPPSQAQVNGQLGSSSPYCSPAGCTAPLVGGHACGQEYRTFCPATGVCTTSGSCP